LLWLNFREQAPTTPPHSSDDTDGSDATTEVDDAIAEADEGVDEVAEAVDVEGANSTAPTHQGHESSKGQRGGHPAARFSDTASDTDDDEEDEDDDDDDSGDGWWARVLRAASKLEASWWAQSDDEDDSGVGDDKKEKVAPVGHSSRFVTFQKRSESLMLQFSKTDRAQRSGNECRTSQSAVTKKPPSKMAKAKAPPKAAKAAKATSAAAPPPKKKAKKEIAHREPKGDVEYHHLPNDRSDGCHKSRALADTRLATLNTTSEPVAPPTSAASTNAVGAAISTHSAIATTNVDTSRTNFSLPHRERVSV